MSEYLSKVGIVVPVYKVKPEYLNQCVDSIINQTYKNVEIVLVDDCSPDNCGELCEKYALIDKRITVVHHGVNKGLPAARNTGFDNLSKECKWVTFIDSDDWLDYTTIEKVLKRINVAYSDADVCLFPACQNYLNLEVRDDEATERVWETREALDSLSIEGLSMVYKSHKQRPTAIDSAWAKMISTEFIKKSKVRFRPLPFREDGMYFQEIVYYAKKIVEVTEGMYHYRATSGSMVNSYRKNAPTELKMFMDELKQFSDSVGKNASFYQAFYSYALIPAQIVVTQFFYHPANKTDRNTRYNECRFYMEQEPYNQMFNNIDFFKLKRNYQIKYLCLRLGFYQALRVLRDIYNKKNNLTCYQ